LPQDDVAKRLGWWFREEQPLLKLTDELRSKFSEDRIFIEEAEVKITRDKPSIIISLRHPVADDLAVLEQEIKASAVLWMDARVFNA
jgi:hypothetical protein